MILDKSKEETIIGTPCHFFLSPILSSRFGGSWDGWETEKENPDTFYTLPVSYPPIYLQALLANLEALPDYEAVGRLQKPSTPDRPSPLESTPNSLSGPVRNSQFASKPYKVGGGDRCTNLYREILLYRHLVPRRSLAVPLPKTSSSSVSSEPIE